MINKNMIVTDILAVDDDIAPILMQMGMHCIGCMAAGGEDLETAMAVHGYSDEDVETVVNYINEYLKSKAANAAKAE